MQRLYVRLRVHLEPDKEGQYRYYGRTAQRYRPFGWYCPKCKNLLVDPPSKEAKDQ
jgi:hypothetical protein